MGTRRGRIPVVVGDRVGVEFWIHFDLRVGRLGGRERADGVQGQGEARIDGWCVIVLNGRTTPATKKKEAAAACHPYFKKKKLVPPLHAPTHAPTHLRHEEERAAAEAAALGGQRLPGQGALGEMDLCACMMLVSGWVFGMVCCCWEAGVLGVMCC